MDILHESLRCRACGKEIDREEEYSFSNDLCDECSLAVEIELENDE